VFFQLSSTDADKISAALDGGKRLAEILKNLPKRHLARKHGSLLRRARQQAVVSNRSLQSRLGTGLELDAQRQLQLPRVADHRRDRPHAACADRRGRLAELRMIKHIERLGPELYLQLFLDREVLEQ